MARDEIRVQYSGLIIFTAQILSLVTGLIFTLLLTRNMSKDQYGIWSFIFAVIGPFTLLSGLFPFWATRFAARGKEDAIKTAVSANLIVGLVATAVYLTLLPSMISAFHVSNDYLIVYAIASLQIMNTFLTAILEGCLRAVKPQAIGYGLLIEEISKVTLAYILIVGFGQLFLGALIGLIVGASVQAAFYVWLLTGSLQQKIRWSYLKEWLKGSTAFIYNLIGNQLVALVLYLLFLFGGQVALGEYQAAATFAAVIGYSFSLTFALYPKILAKNNTDNIALSLKTMLMLAFPMTTIVIILSKSLLTVLNVSYSAASSILVVLALDTLVVLISQFYSSLLMGMERFDEKGRISLSRLVRSKIFMVFTVPYIQAAIALPSVYYVLTQLSSAGSVQAVSYVVIINLIVHMVTFTGLYALMRGSVRMHVAWTSVGKYLLSSAVAGAVIYPLPQTTTLFATFGKVAISGATYAALLLAIDADARRLITQIWTEINTTFRRKGKR